MAMISGAFTDEVVRMMRGSEHHPPAYGDVIVNDNGLYGVYGDGVVYLSKECVVCVPYADFAKQGVGVLRFPVPYGDGFRFVLDSGTIWIPEFSEAERDFLRENGYTIRTATQTVAKITSALGKKHHAFYPISCKTGLMRKEDAEKLVICLKKVM